MPALAVPLAADKLGAWESWVEELKGPRKAGFDDMNARLGFVETIADLHGIDPAGPLPPVPTRYL